MLLGTCCLGFAAIDQATHHTLQVVVPGTYQGGFPLCVFSRSSLDKQPHLLRTITYSNLSRHERHALPTLSVTPLGITAFCLLQVVRSASAPGATSATTAHSRSNTSRQRHKIPLQRANCAVPSPIVSACATTPGSRANQDLSRHRHTIGIKTEIIVTKKASYSQHQAKFVFEARDASQL